ncbi:transposase [Streptomyces sp. NPDC056161]|uniref:transposase n=1 Tax=Streptomyces sp. NPDC056161 TaxID=3345732 RepID=UPI0035E2CC16
MPLSRTSVLFQLMRTRLPSVATPRVLGVDDFALYRDVYGTLLVDADTRLPIELWAGRDAEQLAAWLRTHPGVEVVCRDGSLVYRQGITDGAPDAVRVSERFHLWQGLSKRVSDVAAAHRGCLSAAVSESHPASPPSAERSEAADTPARRHAKRPFEAVHAVSDPSRSLSATARDLGMNRRTVPKYARATSWQECLHRTPPRRSTSLDPYLEYLRQRWEEGEHAATVLHQEIVARATAVITSGSRWPSRRCVAVCRSTRHASGHPRLARSPGGSPPHRPGVACTPPRHSGGCLNTARSWTEPTTWYGSTRPCSTPATRPAAGLARPARGLPALAGLVKAVREDQYAAVQGITTPFNSGVNEGRITDLKLQKRITAGRAGVPLRHRVILMAHLRRRYP